MAGRLFNFYYQIGKLFFCLTTEFIRIFVVNLQVIDHSFLGRYGRIA